MILDQTVAPIPLKHSINSIPSHLLDEEYPQFYPGASSCASACKMKAMATHHDREPQHLALSVSDQHHPNDPSSHFIGNMFGALNRFISRLDAGPEEEPSSTPGFGFQVLRNTNSELPLDPWFDFIIGINGRTIVSKTCHQKIKLFSLTILFRTIRTQIYLLQKFAIVLAQR